MVVNSTNTVLKVPRTLMAAPLKGKFVDLATSSLHKAVSLNKLNTTPTSSSSSSNCGPSRIVTPKHMLPRQACAAAASPATLFTPSSAAALRQGRLMMSEEKSKKADEKKMALLDLRINEMKTKREKRMGKFAENK